MGAFLCTQMRMRFQQYWERFSLQAQFSSGFEFGAVGKAAPDWYAFPIINQIPLAGRGVCGLKSGLKRVWLLDCFSQSHLCHSVQAQLQMWWIPRPFAMPFPPNPSHTHVLTCTLSHTHSLLPLFHFPLPFGFSPFLSKIQYL